MSSSTLASFKMARNCLINCETEMLDAEYEFRAKLHKWIARVENCAKACSRRGSRLRFSSSQEQISIELRHKHHVSSSTLHFLNASSPSSTILLHIQYSRSPTSGAQAEELVEVFAFHLALVLCINSIVVLPLNAARAQECESARAHLEQLVPFSQLFSASPQCNGSSSNATLLHIQYLQRSFKHQQLG